MNQSEAYQKLLKPDFFATGPTGDGGEICDYEKALALLLTHGNAKRELKALLQQGSSEGKMYALLGLHSLSQAAYAQAVARYRSLRTGSPTVTVASGCLRYPQTDDHVIAGIESGEWTLASSHRDDAELCPLHKLRLEHRVVPIRYGRFDDGDDYLQARDTFFPNADRGYVLGGCVVRKQRDATIPVCEACTTVMEEWIKQRKTNTSAKPAESHEFTFTRELAIALAIELWTSTYGADHVERYKPYSATLENRSWMITGHAPPGITRGGGSPEATVSQTNGQISKLHLAR